MCVWQSVCSVMSFSNMTSNFGVIYQVYDTDTDDHREDGELFVQIIIK